jgi:SAM-dependent methyltransferase
MSEISSGVRTILSYAKIYDLFMRLINVDNARTYLSSKYIRAQNGDRVLDIGCGTAEIRDFLPAVQYFGFDPNSRYIETARKRLSDVPDCTFFCSSIEQTKLNAYPKFDIVLAIGVLHHLDDESAIHLTKIAKSTLKENGRLILWDTCFIDGQPPIARYLAGMDRGQNVRDVESYLQILDTVFKNVNFAVRHDLLRFPYTLIITECRAE